MLMRRKPITLQARSGRGSITVIGLHSVFASDGSGMFTRVDYLGWSGLVNAPLSHVVADYCTEVLPAEFFSANPPQFFVHHPALRKYDRYYARQQNKAYNRKGNF